MKKFLLVTVLIIVVFSLWSYASMGGFKTIEPHFAGSCETVTGLGSAEDIQIDHEANVAFISAKDRLAGAGPTSPNNGTIAVYDLAAAPDTFLMEPLAAPADFSPHGLSLYKSGNGERRLYVINHRASGEDTIEVFTVNPDHSLDHQRTIRHPLLESPNDLIAVGPDQFYVANDTGASNGFEKGMEMMGLMSLSKIVYFDGENVTVAIDGFPTSGGIAASADGTMLYIGGTSSESLEIYRRDTGNGALSFVQSIPLSMAADNIDLAADGGVWVAGHPKVIDLIGHFTSAGEKPAPSQVYVIAPNLRANDGSLGEPVDLFTSLGVDLSASSVAVEHQGKFYMGGITPLKMLVCQPG